MAKCNKIYRTIDRVCIGSMNRKIIIYVRSITPTSNNGIDFTETFTQPVEVWSMVETVSGITIFDESNIERDVSHIFYIRYIANFTAERWVEFNNKYYDILKVENMEENNRFLKLSCTERGITAVAVNEA